MQTVVETPIFIRRAEKLLSAAEHAGLIEYRANSPQVGDETVGTSGVRAHEIVVKPADIQRARKWLGLSQNQFAAAFGVSASTLKK